MTPQEIHWFMLALYDAVAAVCPAIDGVKGNPEDRKTWSIQFRKGATEAEREAAAAVLESFEPTETPQPDPIAKLTEFLNANPDVATLINQTTE